MRTHGIELLAWARSANGRNDPSNPPMVAAYEVRQSFAADIWAEEERLTREAFCTHDISRRSTLFRAARCLPMPGLARLVLAAERGKVPSMSHILEAEKSQREVATSPQKKDEQERRGRDPAKWVSGWKCKLIDALATAGGPLDRAALAKAVPTADQKEMDRALKMMDEAGWTRTKDGGTCLSEKGSRLYRKKTSV